MRLKLCCTQVRNQPGALGAPAIAPAIAPPSHRTVWRFSLHPMYLGYRSSPLLLPCLVDFIANDFAPSGIFAWLRACRRIWLKKPIWQPCCRPPFLLKPNKLRKTVFKSRSIYFTSKTPCLAMNRERASPSAKEISLFGCFLLLLQRNRTQRFPRQRNWRRTCVCAVTPPPTFANFITIGSQAKHQILAQSVNRFLRYGDGVCTCARATCRGTQLMTCIKHTANGSLTTHLISAQCAQRFPRYGKGVRTCGCTPPMTCIRHLGNDSKPTHQI